MEAFLNDPDFLSFLCGAAAFVVVVLVWSAFTGGTKVENRLKIMAEHRAALQDAASGNAKGRRDALRRAHFMKRVVQQLKLTQGKSVSELKLKLARAGYRGRDAVIAFLFAKFVGLIGAGALAGFYGFVMRAAQHPNDPMTMGLLIMLTGALVGWMVPDLIVKNKAQKRGEALKKAMPDALDLMVICAEAGLSLDASFERVSRETGQASPELAEEMGVTAVELSLFPERSKALQGLAERVPLPGVLSLVNTLIQTEKFGTPLAMALRVLSGEMREERIMAAEEKAARLPAILTVPMIIFILPPLFVVLIGPAALKVMTMLHH